MSEPTPIPAADTRQRILDAAEALFAREGIAHTPTRAILRAAGQRNESALQYHFGGRDGLVRALHERRMTQVEARRDARIEALAADAELGAREIVELQIRPFIEAAREEPGFVNYLAAIGEVVFSPRAELMDLVGRYEITRDAALAPHLARAMRGASEATLNRRSDLARRFMIMSLSQWAREHGDFTTPEADRFVADLLVMLTAMVTAGGRDAPQA